MSRFAFYFTIAVLAFGFGSLIAIGFYWKTDGKMNETKIQTESKPKEVSPVEPVFYETTQTLSDDEKEIPFCRDEKFLPLWNELKKDKEFLKRVENPDKDAGCEGLLEVEKVDLNGDRRDEFIVWGRSAPELCGGTGNCAIWIFEKKNGGYKLLLQSVAYNDATKWFEAKRAKTNGYRNILLKSHFTAAETTYVFYKFNGTKYVEDKCLMYRYFSYEDKTSVMTCKEHSEQIENELRES